MHQVPGVNGLEGGERIDFEMIYSDNMCEAMTVVNAILSVWDLEHVFYDLYYGSFSRKESLSLSLIISLSLNNNDNRPIIAHWSINIAWGYYYYYCRQIINNIHKSV